MYSFVLTGKLCLSADNWDVYQGPSGQEVGPHMQIVCACGGPASAVHVTPPPQLSHAHTHRACMMTLFLCISCPGLRLPSSTSLSLCSRDFTPPKTQTNKKKTLLVKMHYIKTFLFTKLQSCQLNLINYSNIYPPSTSSTMPGEFLIKPAICFKLVPLSVHLCKIPGIVKDLSIGYLVGLI